jgi:hypothetical protein
VRRVLKILKSKKMLNGKTEKTKNNKRWISDPVLLIGNIRLFSGRFTILDKYEKLTALVLKVFMMIDGICL